MIRGRPQSLLFQNEMVSENTCCFELSFDMETPESRHISHFSWQILKLEDKLDENEEWHSSNRLNEGDNSSVNYSVLSPLIHSSFGVNRLWFSFFQVHDDERLLACHLIPETHLQAASRRSGSHPHPQHQWGECSSFILPDNFSHTFLFHKVPGLRVVRTLATLIRRFPGKWESSIPEQ